MRTSNTLVFILPLTLLACGSPKDATNNSSASINAVTATDAVAIPEDSDSVAVANGSNIAVADAVAGWAGRWTGPEGLFLDIKPVAGGTAGTFALTIKDTLDSQGNYEGKAKDGVITFTRNGKAETIRPGTGTQTGFKYLLEKKDCLIVQEGKEGYCR
jgi:hypothetical protein